MTITLNDKELSTLIKRINNLELSTGRAVEELQDIYSQRIKQDLEQVIKNLEEAK